ncbi:MAG: hypothetical protein EA402_00495 [Planctomycetota bacterium]|nr:MAG: hypothetical protein EA402_00495 [Planctomycetota bacterium]
MGEIRRIFPRWWPCPRCGCREAKRRSTGARDGSTQQRRCAQCDRLYEVGPLFIETEQGIIDLRPRDILSP